MNLELKIGKHKTIITSVEHKSSNEVKEKLFEFLVTVINIKKILEKK